MLPWPRVFTRKCLKVPHTGSFSVFPGDPPGAWVAPVAAGLNRNIIHALFQSLVIIRNPNPRTKKTRGRPQPVGVVAKPRSMWAATEETPNPTWTARERRGSLPLILLLPDWLGGVARSRILLRKHGAVASQRSQGRLKWILFFHFPRTKEQALCIKTARSSLLPQPGPGRG